jgi:hypothetical protein
LECFEQQQNLAIFDILHAFYPDLKPSMVAIERVVNTLHVRKIISFNKADVSECIDELYKKKQIITSSSNNNLRGSSSNNPTTKK